MAMIERLPIWLRALAVQIGAGFCLAYLHQAGALGRISGSALWLAGVDGLLALALSGVLRLPVWWLPIQALFVPSLVLALRLDIPPAVYLGGFVLSWLVFRSNPGERVPLYLTNRATWEAVAELLPERDGFAFVDLGCGLGGGLAFLAERNPAGQFVGVESAPLPFLLARWRVRRLANCKIRFGDLHGEDLSRYDAVYAFLSPDPMPALWRKARREMRPGSLFISNSFEVPGIEPDRTVVLSDGRRTRLLIWRM
jgi:hypothetical protein